MSSSHSPSASNPAAKPDLKSEANSASAANSTSATAASSSNSSDKKTDKDWGLSGGKTRAGLQTKIGLALVLILVGAFGYVVYRRINATPATPGTEQEVAQTTPDGAPTEPQPADASNTQLLTPPGGNSLPAPLPTMAGDTPSEGDPFAAAPAASRTTSASPAARPLPDIMDLDEQSEPLPNHTTAEPLAATPATEFVPQRSSAPNTLRPVSDLSSNDDLAETLEEIPTRSVVRSNPRTLEGADSTPAAAREFEAQPLGQTPSRNVPSLQPLASTPTADSARVVSRQVSLQTADDLGSSTPEAVEAAPTTPRSTTLAPIAQEEPLPAAQAPARTTSSADEMFAGFAVQELHSQQAQAQTRVRGTAPGARYTAASSNPAATNVLQRPQAGQFASGSAQVSPHDTESGRTTQVTRRTPPDDQRLAYSQSNFSGRSASPVTLAADTRGSAGAGAGTLGRPVGMESGGTTAADFGHDPASDTYTVVPNDNFWTISRKNYGTVRYFLALTRYNETRVPDPTQMRPGMQIATPPRATLEARFPETIDHHPAHPEPRQAPARQAPVARRPADGGAEPGEAASGFFFGDNGEPLYRIGHDDTLSSISQRHLGRASRWNDIFESNRDILKTPDNLKIGTVIRLPNDASQISSIRNGAERR